MIATNRELNHWLMIKIMKAYKIKPHDVGIYTDCACHPASNPAARDYRRRTKHRRRRQR